MCAIIDNDVIHQLFGDDPTEPALYFLRWLSRRNGGIIVAGGRLHRELAQNPKYLQFFTDRFGAGRARTVDNPLVDAEEETVRALRPRSNDTHVLALARLSGARLLFTNDEDLKRDFANPDIIPGTPGQIYTTNRGRRVRSYAPQEITRVTRTHRSLLRRTDLCVA